MEIENGNRRTLAGWPNTPIVLSYEESVADREETVALFATVLPAPARVQDRRCLGRDDG